jgi:arginase
MKRNMADSPAAKEAAPPKRLAIFGIPYDEKSSFLRGAADAPAAIRRALASDSSNQWSENQVDLGLPGVLSDAGNLEFYAGGEDFLSRQRIEQAVFELLDGGLTPILLGGDHSITYPIVRAFKRTFGRLQILHFDAHPDLYESFQDDRYSHACPFARILEEGLADRLVQIGIRTMTGSQQQQILRYGVEVVEMKNWKDDLIFSFEAPLYISFDMDCLDPAFAPGVSHWEPGGFSTRQVLGVIQKVRGQLVGADLVELNPRRDRENFTAMVSAKLLKEIAARVIGD